MAPNRIPEFPYQLAEYLEQARRTWMIAPIYLGGTSGSGGGSGGPPGGFIGYLAQTRVTYDSSELAIQGTSGSASLLDNLNHIRWMITSGSFGGFGALAGSGVAGRAAFWTSGSVLGSDASYLFNSTTKRLTLSTTGSGAGIMVGNTLLYQRLLGASPFPLTVAGNFFVEQNIFALGGLNLGPENFGSVGEGSMVGQSNSAFGVTWAISALSNQATADAYWYASTTGSGGGDPFIRMEIGSAGYTNGWAVGIDNSAGNLYKISASGALGTNDIITLYPDDLNKMRLGSYTFKLGASLEVDATGASAGNVLAYDGSKWVPSSAGGGGGISGSGISGRVALWTSGSFLSNDAGLLYDSTNDRLTLATSGSAAGFLINDTLLYRKSSNLLGIGGGLDVDGPFKIGTRQLTLDAAIELDPTGAISGQFLGYNGTKWVPTSGSTSGSSGSPFASDYSQSAYITTSIDLGTSTDGSFVDADATNAKITITPTLAGKYRAIFTFTHYTNATAIDVNFRLTDGTTDGVAQESYSPGANLTKIITLTHIFTWTTAAQTVKLQKRVMAATIVTTNRIEVDNSAGMGLYMSVERIGS